MPLTSAYAQTAPPQATEKARPKVALVLSGGGARGFAHVGVLKVLQELHVPVDMVVGTSMGAVVGGAYAAGTPVAQLEKIINDIQWDDIFVTTVPRQDLDFRRRDEDNLTLGRLAFGLTKEGLTLPRATLGSHVLDETLRRLAPPSIDRGNLNDLPLPFRALATDLVSGEPVVMERTSLFNAMRASMAIPGAFAPLEIDGALLVDGGLARNLPVDVARAMGAQIIIAVNVGTPRLPRERINSALDVAQQMINILTEQNVGRSLAELTERDILISPDLDKVSAGDFERSADIIARGEKATRAQLAKLSVLAIDPQLYAALDAVRTASAGPQQTLTISKVEVAGADRTQAEVLKRALEITLPAQLTDAEVAKKVRKLGASGEFERIDFSLLGSGTDRVLLVRPIDSITGNQTLRFGMRLESDFQTENRFSLIAAHTARWVNSYGGEWRTIAQIGGERRLESEFYQPVSRSRDWFVTANAGYQASDVDLFNVDGQRRLAKVAFAQSSIGVFAGRRLGLIGEARIGRTRNRITAESLIGLDGFPAQSILFNANQGSLRLDTLDNVNFPRQGYRFSVDWLSTPTPNSRVRSDNVELRVDGAFSRGDNTLYSTLLMSDARGGTAASSLGGFLTLSGTPANSLTGTRAVLLRSIASRRLGALTSALGGNIYAGVSLEVGSAYDRTAGLRSNDLRRAFALLVGADSIIGPVYLGVGKTVGGSSAWYLYVGQP
ncbi:MAG: patatin-like phospholipase family protein [Burkholderiaceae bacterium]